MRGRLAVEVKLAGEQKRAEKEGSTHGKGGKEGKEGWEIKRKQWRLNKKYQGKVSGGEWDCIIV